MNTNEIVLKIPRRYPTNKLTGLVRLTQEAEITLQKISDETGLPLRTIASEMIIQGAKFVRFEEE